MTVEINIVAFISNEYINDSFQVSAPEGSSLKQMLKTAVAILTGPLIKPSGICIR